MTQSHASDGKPLFRRRHGGKSYVPLTIVILGAIVALFALIPPAQYPLGIDPASVTLPTRTPTPTAKPAPTDVHGGRIVFTCAREGVNQICEIGADGKGYAQLTVGDSNKYYPAVSRDGTKIVYAENLYDLFDLYLLDLDPGEGAGSGRWRRTKLTDTIGNAFSPSFSPDASEVAFANRTGPGPAAIWIVRSSGEDPHPIYTPPRDIGGLAWSPDGSLLAFTMASDLKFAYEVFLLDPKHPGEAPSQVSHGLPAMGGSVSWSPNQADLLIFAGPAAAREIFRLELGSGRTSQLTFGGNNASPAYSPDGLHIVFNSVRSGSQADLYIMRADGHSMRQLTQDPEPDWQPQWGG